MERRVFSEYSLLISRLQFSYTSQYFNFIYNSHFLANELTDQNAQTSTHGV